MIKRREGWSSRRYAFQQPERHGNNFASHRVACVRETKEAVANKAKALIISALQLRKVIGENGSFWSWRLYCPTTRKATPARGSSSRNMWENQRSFDARVQRRACHRPGDSCWRYSWVSAQKSRCDSIPDSFAKKPILWSNRNIPDRRICAAYKLSLSWYGNRCPLWGGYLTVSGRRLCGSWIILCWNNFTLNMPQAAVSWPSSVDQRKPRIKSSNSS